MRFRSPGRVALLALLAAAHLGLVCQDGNGVAFVGDSITEGVVGGGGASWVQLVANTLPARVRNAGCGSGTTSTWLFRLGEVHVGSACPQARVGPEVDEASAFDAVLTPRLPGVRWVFVMLGAGDSLFAGNCLGGAWSPCDADPNDADTFESNLRALVALIGANAPPTLEGVVLVVPPRFASPLLADANALIDSYAPRVAEVCADTALAVCGPDLRDALDGSHYDVSDILHPNAAGQAVLAAEYLAAVQALE